MSLLGAVELTHEEVAEGLRLFIGESFTAVFLEPRNRIFAHKTFIVRLKSRVADDYLGAKLLDLTTDESRSRFFLLSIT